LQDEQRTLAPAWPGLGTAGGFKVGRNEPCPCGSGKKYKRCCLPDDEAWALAGPRLHRQPLGTSYEAGWAAFLRGRQEEALDAWWPVWEALREPLASEGLGSWHRRDQQELAVWITSLQTVLAACAARHPEQSSRWLAWTETLREWVERDPVGFAPLGHRRSITMMHALALFAAGREEEGEAWFERLRSEDATDPWLYYRWAEAYANRWGDAPKDADRAQGLYRQALAMVKDEEARALMEDARWALLRRQATRREALNR
jgi:tetratricopeptide (TPR) repeat protein